MKKQVLLWGKLESDHTHPGKGSEKVSEDLNSTPQAHLWYMTAQNSFFFFLINKTSNEQQQTPGKTEILVSRVTTLSDLNTQFSMNNHKTYKEQEIMANSRGKKISRNCP